MKWQTMKDIYRSALQATLRSERYSSFDFFSHLLEGKTWSNFCFDSIGCRDKENEN